MPKRLRWLTKVWCAEFDETRVPLRRRMVEGQGIFRVAFEVNGKKKQPLEQRGQALVALTEMI